MGFVNFIIELLKDPRAAIAGWIAMGVAPTLGFIFLIVFIETGVVFFPFLPGDSLLFAAGVFAAPDAATGKAALPLFWLLPVVWCAPIIGDQCNYFIGHFFGRRIIQSGKVKALTPERLAKTEHMIEKWGPLAVFLGRFFPFIRTFMPFISGISGMRWSRFTPFSVLGGLCWSTLFTLLGYFFGLHGILAGVLLSLLIVVFCWKPYFLFRRGLKENLWILCEHVCETYTARIGGVGRHVFDSWPFAIRSNGGNRVLADLRNCCNRNILFAAFRSPLHCNQRNANLCAPLPKNHKITIKYIFQYAQSIRLRTNI